VEMLNPVLEDGDVVSYGCGWRSSGTEELSDECSVSPSEFSIFWSTMANEKSPTADADTEASADNRIFHADGLSNSMLGKDNIWSHSVTDVCGVEGGAVKTSWTADPLQYGGSTASSLRVIGDTTDPDFDTDPPPFCISSETNLDADVAFAFTHLVSGVVSVLLSVASFHVVSSAG